ncbi:uncharacterized protein LOC141846964 [Curcuma longa]|uniref:uncharacterized protein LOC141846964 n=1 Tax=Curcuma longa TaxID=136217 RepID=UPI003D9F6EEE
MKETYGGVLERQTARRSSDPAAEKSTKKKKKLQQPIKVVYISNPMKVKATVAEFRSVVQGLTGRGSDLATSLSKYGAVAVDYCGAPDLADLPPSEEEPFDGSACADLSGDGRAKRVARKLELDDPEELPEFLSTPPVYYELQGINTTSLSFPLLYELNFPPFSYSLFSFSLISACRSKHTCS